MTRRKLATTWSGESGFSIVELLMVIAMLGLVMGAFQGLYVAHQRSATTETEVIDVQQNLRIGIDHMARDISMAGFMISGANPVAAVVNNASPTADSVTLNTGAESLVSATVDSATSEVILAAGNILDLAVIAFNGSVGGFETADENVASVRIVNYRGEPLGVGTTFTVIQVSPAVAACGAVPAPCMQLRADIAGTGTITRGDTIVKTSVPGAAEAFPHTVTYLVAACPAPLAGNCLMRTTVPGVAGGNVVATNVSDFQVSYLLAGTTEVAAPTAAQLSAVRAVRITLSGQLVDTAAVAGGNLKTRTLTSIIAIRNA
jgi:Tfp pilus assembly protein PilW